MKKLTIIVHTSLQQSLADCLRSIEHLNTFIFSHVEEHSRQLEHDPFLSAHDRVVGYVPQVRVDVLLPDDAVATVITSIRNSKCNFKGKGLYWISDLPEAGEL